MLPTAMGTALPNLQPQTLFSKHLLPVLKGSSRENLPELECVSSLVHSLCGQFLEAPRGPYTTPWWLCSQFLEVPRGPHTTPWWLRTRLFHTGQQVFYLFLGRCVSGHSHSFAGRSAVNDK